MNTRRRKAAAVFVCAFVGVLAVLAWRSLFHPEPVYNGKPLSTWAEQYGSNNWRAGGKPAAREAQAAIRQIGTNGIPFLLNLIRSQESPLKKRLRTMVPQTWHQRLHLRDTSQEVCRTGAHGLAALGTNAACAVPELIEIAKHHPDEYGRYIGVFTLRMLGAQPNRLFHFSFNASPMRCGLSAVMQHSVWD